MGKVLFQFFNGMHAKIIKATRGRLFGRSTLVLTHKGAKSGKVRDTPLRFFRDGANYLIVASAGGAPRNPGWYYNLMANPDATVMAEGKTLSVTARDSGPARQELWQKVVTEDPRFAAYEGKSDRTIPIVILEPAAA